MTTLNLKKGKRMSTSESNMTELQAAALAVAQNALGFDIYVGENDDFDFTVNDSEPHGDGARVLVWCNDTGNQYEVLLQANLIYEFDPRDAD